MYSTNFSTSSRVILKCLSYITHTSGETLAIPSPVEISGPGQKSLPLDAPLYVLAQVLNCPLISTPPTQIEPAYIDDFFEPLGISYLSLLSLPSQRPPFAKINALTLFKSRFVSEDAGKHPEVMVLADFCDLLLV